MKLRGNNTYVKIINHNHNVLFCYRIKGHFHKLNLDKKFYIGGVPHIEKGLVVFDNFTGCIENMYLNHSSVSAGYLYPLKYDFQNIHYDNIGNEVTKGCKPDPFKTPVTFKNSKSFVRLPGYTEGSENLDVSLEFRTYEENGLLVFHHLNSEGFIKLFMEDARIKVQIVSADMPQVELDTFDQTYNDGKWHTGTYIISTKNFKKIHELSTNFFFNYM